MARRKGRILAFQALYSWNAASIPLADLLDFAWIEKESLDRLGEDGLAFARLLTSGTIENIAEIDTVIKKFLMHWDFNRLAKVDLAVLRISVYPLLFQRDIPAGIIIDEAIDICKEFAADDAYKFVNAVLDSVRKYADEAHP